MDFRLRVFISTLIVVTVFFKSGAAASVHFVDSKGREFLRQQSLDTVQEGGTLTNHEVGAAISILLGSVPGPLSSLSSSKLDEILKPDPFNRPQTVFMMEIHGIEVSENPKDAEAVLMERSLRRKLTPLSDKVGIELSDDGASLIYLDDHGSDWSDKDIGEFASWFGGSYVTDGSGESRGELSIPLPDNDHAKFSMSKEDDLEVVKNVAALTKNTRTLGLLRRNYHNQAQLISGTFNAHKDSAEKVKGLLFVVLAKLFDSLEEAQNGRIVGVLYFDDDDGKFGPVSVTRQLVEASNSTVIEEVELVRRTLTWLTATILLVATLLGVHFLLNMPVTRDTLLYSNVKLD